MENSNNKYLVKNSTKEQRKKYIEDAIALSTLDAKEPTPFGMELYQKYVDGEMELQDIEAEIMNKYSQFGTPEGDEE